MRVLDVVLLVVVIVLAACRDREPETCTCVPGNVSNTRAAGDAAPMDGVALVAKLRRHQRMVDERRNPRDVKVFDDELRHAIVDFCRPCSQWVPEQRTIDELFPLKRLDDATHGICLGLVLRDGTIAYGDAHPRACRAQR